MFSFTRASSPSVRSTVDAARADGADATINNSASPVRRKKIPRDPLIALPERCFMSVLSLVSKKNVSRIHIHRAFPYGPDAVFVYPADVDIFGNSRRFMWVLW